MPRSLLSLADRLRAQAQQANFENKPETAARLLKQAIKLQPDIPHFHLLYSQTCAGLGRRKEALAHAELALGPGPENRPDAVAWKAELLTGARHVKTQLSGQAKSKRTLSIASYGFALPSQMTLESLNALRSCSVVYSSSVDTASAGAILDLGISLIPVDSRSPDYILKKILKALKKHVHVGLLTFGNPLFLNPQMSKLLHTVSRLAEVEMFPGISSFDMLINMFGMTNLSEKGLFIANFNFFMKDPQFEPGPDIFFFSPFYLNIKGGGRFKARFIKALAGKYARRFPAYLVKCTNPAGVEVIKGCMSCLPALLKRCEKQHTLVIFSESRLSSLDNPPPWFRFTARSICDCD